MDARSVIIAAFDNYCKTNYLTPNGQGMLSWDDGEAEAWLIKIAKGASLTHTLDGYGLAMPILQMRKTIRD